MPAPNIVQVIGGSAKSQQRPLGIITIQQFNQAITATQATSFALGPDQINTAISAAAVSVAALLKSPGKIFAASISSSPTLTKAVRVVKSLSQATLASLSTHAADLVSIAVSVSSSIALRKAVARSVSVSNATVLTMARALSVSRSAVQAESVAIGRAVTHALSLSQSTVASVIEGAGHALTILATATTQAFRSVVVLASRPATQAELVTLPRAVARAVSAAAASAVTLPRVVARTVRAAQSVIVVSIFDTALHHLAIIATVTTSATHAAAVAISKAFTQGQAASVLRGFPRAISATVTSIASLTMHAADHVHVTINQAVVTTLARAVAVQRSIVQPSTLSLMRVTHKSYALTVALVAHLRPHFVPQFFPFGPDWLVKRAQRFFSLVRGRSTLTLETAERNWTVATRRSFEVQAQPQSDTVRDTRGDS